VETKEQMELLKSIDCDIIQGYYFSKPLPPEEFCKLFRN
jgi:EAL domain-containing protein (putative c-di-GMP-specific phosphodiesterase class I)